MRRAARDSMHYHTYWRGSLGNLASTPFLYRMLSDLPDLRTWIRSWQTPLKAGSRATDLHWWLLTPTLSSSTGAMTLRRGLASAFGFHQLEPEEVLGREGCP